MYQSSLERLTKIVESRKGLILVLGETLVEKSFFECSNKHQFWIRANEVVNRNMWCRKCTNQAKKRKSETRLREIVVNKRGKCLFTEFLGTHEKYKFQCEKDHIFSTQAYHIINNGFWCKECKKEDKQLKNFKKLIEIAQKRGGKFLSQNVILVKEKYKFECSMKHVFQMRAIDIFAGKWCRDCSKYIKERICRVIMNNLFDTTFISDSPSWLKSDTNTQLQLDGYCDKTQIAFEYNGLQHYKYIESYHKSIENFEKQKQRDREKKLLCDQEGIKLVVIPTYKARNLKSIQEHVIEACEKAGVRINKNIKLNEIDFSSAYVSKDLERIEKINQLLKELKGRLICYQGGVCQVECMLCNNIWHINYKTLINRKSWCKKCSGNYKRDLKYLQELAQKKEGICLAAEYINSHTKVEWKCIIKKHLPWFATPNAVQQGRWCPECASEIKSKNAKKQWASGNLGRYCNQTKKMTSVKETDKSDADLLREVGHVTLKKRRSFSIESLRD